MICQSEDLYGYPCTRTGKECPRCELVCCWDHMDKHGCFPVHDGKTITDLETLVTKSLA